MISFPELLAGFCGWLARASAQACVLIVLVLAAQALLRGKLAPRWRYALWLLVMVRLMLPWAPESPVSVYNLPLLLRHFVVMTASPAHDMGTTEFPMPALVQGEELRTGPSEAPPPAIAQSVQRERRSLLSLVPVSLGVLLPLVWLAGAVVLAGFVLGQSIFLARTVRQRRSLTDQRALNVLEDCKELMGISTYLAVVETGRVRSPALFGFIRPRLLLPAGALEALGPDRLRHVFLHELAHLRRHDVAVNWLMTLLQVLHWFNPLVWYAFGRMRADREMACDALALSHARPGESLEYGRTIVYLLESFSQTRRLPSLAGILENQNQMKRRIAMIARFTKEPKRWPLPALALIVLLGAAALTNAQQDTMTAAEARESASSAKEFVELLVQRDFARAEPLFDAAMKKALPVAKLKETWDALLKESGPFGKVTGYRVERFLSKRIVLVRCEFQNGPLDAKVVYDAQKKITGLWFIPTAVGPAYLSFAEPAREDGATAGSSDIVTKMYNGPEEDNRKLKALIEAMPADFGPQVSVDGRRLFVSASAADFPRIEDMMRHLGQDLQITTFILIPSESIAKDAAPTQDLGKRVVEAVETMLYGKEGKEKAREQGRRLSYDPATFRLTITDYSDRIKLVSTYLASLPQLKQPVTEAAAKDGAEGLDASHAGEDLNGLLIKLHSREGRGADVAKLEKDYLALLKTYTEPGDVGRIYARMAYGLDRSNASASLVAPYAQKAFEYPLGPVDEMRMYLLLGVALEHISGEGMSYGDASPSRREGAVLYLRGMRRFHELDLKPLVIGERPDRRLASRDEWARYNAAVEKATERYGVIGDATASRNGCESHLVFIYSRKPFATEELRGMAKEILGDTDEAKNLIAKVEAAVAKRLREDAAKVVKQQGGNSTPGRTTAESSQIPTTSVIGADGRIVDKMDYPFVDDPAVIGTWKSVDLVGEPGQFKPGQKQFPGDPPIKEFVILPNGKTSKPWETWTKGMIFHSGDRTAGRYDLKELDGSTYMFFERKDGTYLILHTKPKYWVLKKESSGTGGLAEAWAALPSDEEFRRSFPEKIARLDIDTANLDRVIEVLGKPAQFMWGNESYTRDNLPSHYLMVYPDKFTIHMAGSKIVELRYSQPGYFFRDKLQVGSTLEDVLKVVGEPKETVEGKEVKGNESEFKGGILYTNLDLKPARFFARGAEKT